VAGRLARIQKESVPMSVFMLQDDFVAIGLSAGLREVAAEDAWMLFATYDGTARDFFKERKGDKPHWFNNFAPAADSTEHAAFHSLAGQAAFLKEHSLPELVELLKTVGLSPGKIKTPVNVDATTGSTNPYSDEFVGTAAQKEARIASLIRSSATLAGQLARSAGKTITNQPLNPVGAARQR
jgi:hypothetical protein